MTSGAATSMLTSTALIPSFTASIRARLMFCQSLPRPCWAGPRSTGRRSTSLPDGTLSGTPSSGPPVTISATAPVGPQVGALWWDSVGGQLYTFYDDGNSSQWVIAVNAAASLLPASTTVLGGVKVDGTTIKAAADGTISTTVVPMGDNRIINGDMRIDQRNAGASGTASGYTRLIGGTIPHSQASKGTWQRRRCDNARVSLLFWVLSHRRLTRWRQRMISASYQSIEADMVSDFAWGTPNAQPVTLSFWVDLQLDRDV